MKQKDLIRHLYKNGCIFIREGARHSVFFNPLLRKTSTVPRHNEVDNFFSKENLPRSRYKISRKRITFYFD